MGSSNGENSEVQKAREPRRPLKQMFDSVPDRYDLLNRILTLRLDERWRRRAAQLCLQDHPSRILDLCCGTGDLASHLREYADPSVEIMGLDYSPAMLCSARRKLESFGSRGAVSFIEGDAGSMDFPDEHFDVVGIAFAFRNLTWKNPLKNPALSEVYRVLRPGGTFVIVETSQPKRRILRAGFHLYLSTAVATVGGLISGQRGAYRYLAESARRFSDTTEVSSMLSGAGLETTQLETFLGGAAAIHVATKPRIGDPVES